MFLKIGQIVSLLYLFGNCIAASESKTDERIIGGDVVAQGALPYIVTIELQRTNPTQPRKPYCVGSIVNRDWILTTASCATLPKGKYVITAGTVDISSSNTGFGELVREVVKIIPHENFDSTTMQNDVALMKMHLPVYDPFFPIVNGRVKSINLVSPDTTCVNSGEVIVGGWGIRNNSEVLGTNKLLRSVRLPIVPQSTCISNYANYVNHPTSNNFCAGSPGKAPCQGDFGGPVLCKASCGSVPLPAPMVKVSETDADGGRQDSHSILQQALATNNGTSQIAPNTIVLPLEGNYVICGLVSWSRVNGCGLAGSPTVMVRIPKYVQWIKQKLQSNLYSYP